jgi:signal transduction histidine kinase
VSDTGTGIAPEHLPAIFDPHFTTKPPGEGTGLGLAIVQRIVADHGGEVSVDSKPGDGARFTVRFPAASAPQMEGAR